MSSITQSKFIEDWHFKRERAQRTSNLYIQSGDLYCLHGVLLAKRLHDNFIILNTDVKSYSFGHSLYYKALKIISDVAVSLSYSALTDIKLRLDQLEVVFLGKATGGWCREDQVILRVKGTDRVICTLRDQRWVGLVEPYGMHRDYLSAKESLVPQVVKEALGSDSDGVRRQGEWYFIRRPDFKKPRGIKIEHWMRFEKEGHHKATHGIIIDGKMYASGTVRHQGRRPMLSLLSNKKPVWHEVVRSSQVASWKGRFCY